MEVAQKNAIVQKASADSAYMPKVNYKPFAEGISRGEMAGLPAALRREVERLNRAAEEHGKKNEVRELLREFSSSQNNYLMNFVKRLADAVQSGALDSPKNMRILSKLIKENQDAADSLPEVFNSLKRQFGRDFDSIDGSSLESAVRKTLRMCGSRCPVELSKTFNWALQSGAMDDIRQMKEIRLDMEAKTAETTFAYSQPQAGEAALLERITRTPSQSIQAFTAKDAPEEVRTDIMIASLKSHQKAGGSENTGVHGNQAHIMNLDSISYSNLAVLHPRISKEKPAAAFMGKQAVQKVETVRPAIRQVKEANKPEVPAIRKQSPVQSVPKEETDVGKAPAIIQQLTSIVNFRQKTDNSRKDSEGDNNRTGRSGKKADGLGQDSVRFGRQTREERRKTSDRQEKGGNERGGARRTSGQNRRKLQKKGADEVKKDVGLKKERARKGGVKNPNKVISQPSSKKSGQQAQLETTKQKTTASSVSINGKSAISQKPSQRKKAGGRAKGRKTPKKLLDYWMLFPSKRKRAQAQRAGQHPNSEVKTADAQLLGKEAVQKKAA